MMVRLFLAQLHYSARFLGKLNFVGEKEKTSIVCCLYDVKYILEVNTESNLRQFRRLYFNKIIHIPMFVIGLDFGQVFFLSVLLTFELEINVFVF